MAATSAPFTIMFRPVAKAPIANPRDTAKPETSNTIKLRAAYWVAGDIRPERDCIATDWATMMSPMLEMIEDDRNTKQAARDKDLHRRKLSESGHRKELGDVRRIIGIRRPTKRARTNKTIQHIDPYLI